MEVPIHSYSQLSESHIIVDGTFPPPPQIIVSANNVPIPNPEYETWFKKDQMLLSWPFSSLTEEIFPYVIGGLTSSKEGWTALNASFSLISQNRQLQLHIELQELKLNDLSVLNFFKKQRHYQMNSKLQLSLFPQLNSTRLFIAI